MPSVMSPTRRKRPRRQVMPFSGVDVAVVGDDVPGERQGERQRVRRDLAHAVVGRIRDPDAVPCAQAVGVDRVEAGADPAHDAELRQRRSTTRSVIGEYWSRRPTHTLRRRRSLRPRFLHCAVTSSTPAAPKRSRSISSSGNSLSEKRTLGMGYAALDRRRGALVARHRRRATVRGPVTGTGQVRRTGCREPAGARLILSPRAPGSAVTLMPIGANRWSRDYNWAAPPPCPSSGHRHDQPPANDDRRQPPQALMARGTEVALGALASRR